MYYIKCCDKKKEKKKKKVSFTFLLIHLLYLKRPKKNIYPKLREKKKMSSKSKRYINLYTVHVL
jgi:hypothetical protein